jgi:2,5-diamino-6-(ribosylamino)-4(3H)-pyrimidinone 5'-phosphate reductase
MHVEIKSYLLRLISSPAAICHSRFALVCVYSTMSALVPLVESLVPFLDRYLPSGVNGDRPFVTLTYAASLDSRIAAVKGQQTVISHGETKTMTHYLRSKHDGILVGVGTVVADDPGLNCRYKGGLSPRPIIVDPTFRCNLSGESRVIKTAVAQQGLGPWVLTTKGASLRHPDKVSIIEQSGGRVIEMEVTGNLIPWHTVFSCLRENSIKSVMVEGGAAIINSLLDSTKTESLVDSVIVTIGPVFLGHNGVEVSPSSRVDLKEVTWWQGTRDSVVAAKI